MTLGVPAAVTGCVSPSGARAWAPGDLGGSGSGVRGGPSRSTSPCPTAGAPGLWPPHPSLYCTYPSGSPWGTNLCIVSTSLWPLQLFQCFCNWFLVFHLSAKTPAVVLYCRRVASLWQLQQSACGLTGPPGGRLAHSCAHLPPCRRGPFRILKMDLPGLQYMRRETNREQRGCYDAAFNAPSRCGIKSIGSSNARAGRGIQTTRPCPC